MKSLSMPLIIHKAQNILSTHSSVYVIHVNCFVFFNVCQISGQKFAQLEEKVIVSTVLRKFQVESIEPRDKVNVLSELILRPEKGINVKLTRRC